MFLPSRQLCVLVCLLICGALFSVWAADAPVFDEDVEDPSTIRINAYFANIPEYSPPCEDMPLLYDNALTEGIPEDKRFEFQSIRRVGGTYAEMKKTIEGLRKELNILHEDWLFSVLDYHSQFKALAKEDPDFFSQQNYIDNQHLQEAQDKVSANYAKHLLGVYWLYYHESQLRSLARGYYDTIVKGAPPKIDFSKAYERVQKDPSYLKELERERLKVGPSPFDGLNHEKQANMIEVFHRRMVCLRDNRLRVFRELSENTIAVEKSLSEYISATQSPDAPLADLNVVDQANSQIERSVLQETYVWLMDEFAIHSGVYKQMLLSHERKLRNAHLFPLEQTQQSDYPAIGPTQVLPDIPLIAQAREDLAKTRARFGYLILLEEEAKLEGASIANASYLRHFRDTLGGEISKYFGGLSSMGVWLRDKRAGTWDQKALTLSQTMFMFAGMTYQFGAGTLDAALVSPVKGAIIQGARQTGIAGWRTTAERNYEQYTRAVAQFSPRIHFMEKWIEGLDSSQALGYVNYLKSGAKSTGAKGGNAVYGSYPFEDLIGDATFNAGAKGGLAWILEPFAVDPADHAALWLHSSRHAFYGSMVSARDRIAAARGIEIVNPEAAVSTVDLRLGAASVKNSNSDFIFKLPSIMKNEFNKVLGGVYGTQLDFMQNMERQLAEIDLLLGDLGRPEVDYEPEALYRLDPSAYLRYQSLAQHCLEFAQADYHLRNRRWQRIKQYNTTLEQHYHGKRMTASGEVMIAALQREEERRFSQMEARLGKLKLTYLAQTGNYKAASLQAQSLENMENERLKNLGLKQRVDYSTLIAELESVAAANQAITSWESLLNQALVSIIVSPFSTYMNERLLSRYDSKWLKAFRAEQATTWQQEMIKTFHPWSKVMADNGLQGVLKGAAWDVSKSRAAETASWALKSAGDLWNTKGVAFANSYVGEMVGQPRIADAYKIEDTYVHPDDAEALLSELFDLGWDLGAHYATIRADGMARSSVNWWAGKAQFDLLLDRANEARADLQKVFDESTEAALKRLVNTDLSELSADKRRELFDELEKSAARPATSDEVKAAFARYHGAFDQMEAEYGEVRRRLGALNRATDYLSMLSTVRDAALDQIKNTGWDADMSASGVSVPAQAMAATELRTRLLFKGHSVEDLESLVADNVRTNLGMPDQVLRRGADIDLLRDALRSSMAEAKAIYKSENNPESNRIRKVALEIDEIRIKKIDTLLEQFMSKPGMADKVVQIVQGGAAKGNAEYQGIFGDIDFTLMLKAEAVGESDQIKTDLMDFFEANGYPLARSKDSPSSMDSEGFVQPFDHFDSTEATLREVVDDLIEKSKDPTRFYTEAGTVWFINNAAYSGKLLWPKGENKLKFIEATRNSGHGLAIDMARYVGFLASPKYTKEYLRSHPHDRYEYLESALGKGKYFLRLIDAYEMAHPVGNRLYNARKDKKESGNAEEGRDASYHWQILEDARKIIAGQAESVESSSHLFSNDDIEYIEIVAKLKLKDEYGSPWEVILESAPSGLSDEAKKNWAMDKAQETIDWMREKTPGIMAYTSQVWYEKAGEQAKDKDPKVRAKIVAEAQRKMATVWKMIKEGETEAMPYIVSKLKDGELMTEEEHAAEIKRFMDRAVKGKPVADGVERILQNRDSNPAFEGKAREDVDKYLAGEKLNKTVSPEDIEIFAVQKHYNNWFKYLLAVQRNVDPY